MSDCPLCQATARLEELERLLADRIAHPEGLLEKDDVVRWLRISTRQLERYVAAGELPVIDLGRPRFDRRDVEVFLEERKEVRRSNPSERAPHLVPLPGRRSFAERVRSGPGEHAAG